MKSKRAEMFINQKGRIMIPAAYFAMDKCDAARAIEIAEEDMAEKAAKIFAQRCDMYDDDGSCIVGKTCENCKIVTQFKQELME